VYCQQLAGFFSKQWPIGCWVNNHGFDLAAQDAASGVLLLNEHQHRVFQCGFRDGHRAGQRVQNTHFDRLGTFGSSDTSSQRQSCGACQGFLKKGHLDLLAGQLAQLRQTA